MAMQQDSEEGRESVCLYGEVNAQKEQAIQYEEEMGCMMIDFQKRKGKPTNRMEMSTKQMSLTPMICILSLWAQCNCSLLWPFQMPD